MANRTDVAIVGAGIVGLAVACGATASGFIDGIGYLGAVLAGDTIGKISVHYGRQGAFAFLAFVCGCSGFASALYYRSLRQSGKTLVAAAIARGVNPV